MSAFSAETFGQAAEKALRLMNTAGAAVSVIEDGEVVFSGGFGYADIDKGIPMTDDTILPIGSATKAFTAMSAMTLQAEGKLDIDRPVREYLPGFALRDPVASQHAATRDLLCHRTGMPRHDLLWVAWRDVPRAELIERRLPHMRENKTFREKWEYNNYMFAAVGLMVERLTGKRWEDFVSERILAPLGMDSTSTAEPKPGKHPILYKFNRKTGVNEPTAPMHMGAISPAGSIKSTASDMAKWVRLNLAKGKAGETVILPPEAYEQLVKPNIPYELLPFTIPENVGLGYGLGWFIDSYRGERLVQHGGNVFGASALVAFMPERNSGVVVLANQEGTYATYALAYAAFDLMLGKSDKDWPEFLHDKIEEQVKLAEGNADAFKKCAKPDKPFTHPLDEYVGEYDNPGYGILEIARDGDGFLVKLHDESVKLYHMHYDVFYLETRGMLLPGAFKTGFDGNIESVKVGFEPAAKPSEFKKVIKT
ncbi:MAG: serine hydrolase [Oscillospiraceae bacterium]|jgi:CubicO group peptidase (beta-lactamase class C family)|nr:serine hydrolase [Oscillospiraceae bacterium]